MGSVVSPATMKTLAHSVLGKNLGVRRGENVTIETWNATLPWANAFVLEAARLGARPMLLFVDEPTYWQEVDDLPASALGRVGSHEWAALRETDAYVFFYGPNDVARESALPQAKFLALSAFEDEWFRIIEKAHVRSARIDLGRINASEARRFGLDEDDWRKEMIESILVDPDRMHREGSAVGRALQRGKLVRITHSNGTDLDLRLRGRRPRIHDGVIDARDVANGEVFEPLPPGWVAVAVDELHAEGDFVANVASATAASGDDIGRMLPSRGGHWTFRDGKLARFSYEAGGDEFAKAYQRVGRGKERPGALNIGLNPRITRIPLMEDQHRGRVTLSIGRNYFLDGVTRTPHFHAYLVLDGADVQVDGRVIVRAGEIV